MPDIELKNGQHISYHDSGDGVPILFLHSFGHNKNMWFCQLNHYLKQGYRVIAPDMPGHGDSSFDPAAHTVDQFAQLYAEFLDKLGIGKVILAGISIGGYIALRMWARRPEQISALILCSTKAEADSEEIKGRRRAQIESIHKNGLKHFVETGGPKRLSPKVVANKPWVLDWVKMMNFTVSAEANAETLQAMAVKEDDTDALATINVPTLILSGSDDVFIPKDAADKLNSGIKNSVHHVIEDAGHVAVLEQPDAVNRRIDAFLSTL